MCCSNITHCLSVQKYWTKFSLFSKQKWFHEQFWCHAYLFILMWPTIIRINCVKRLRGIWLNSCKQRKYNSRASGITLTHIAGAWVLRDKIWQARLQTREKGQSNTHNVQWGPFSSQSLPSSARLWGKLLVPFSWHFLSQQEPEGWSYATSQSMLPSIKWPLGLLLPK